MSSQKVLCRWGVFWTLAALIALAPRAAVADLIAHYSFDDANDLGADTSGNGYHGTVEGTITADEGVSGGGARFATGAGHYINLPVAAIKADGNIPTSDFTLAVWSNVSDPGSAAYAIFNARANDATFVIHPEIRSTYYRYYLRDYNSTKIGELKTDDAPLFDQWHHIAMTWDRDTTTMAVYIDGELWNDKTDCADLNMAADWDQGARIGYNVDNARQYVGLMDELYLYNETLSAGQIRALAAVPEPSTFVLGLVAIVSVMVFRRKWLR